MRADLGIDGGVVVGIDGSEPSLHALLLASDEARRREVTLHVVRAWTLRTAPRPPGFRPSAVPSVEEFHHWVENRTQALISQTLPTQGPASGIQLHLPRSQAVGALLTASETAELLVVGHRGRGSRLMLGSVAAICVRRAGCPVLVTRPHHRRALQRKPPTP
ncbi:universal stress protein [Actinoalloteichus hymeniacidonis]|uniref:Universal stress protein UspA-like protein n=1 Tax=Actinoalloteichus hymeniacidonis TaxID=340345 RepID=A0AAC9HPS0_9PSEU|nr:universal stress protein [Actinoalloteichus hymeniacidonis]AOS63229.1 universal stress protein UspA-like protein [Actinoalloteichus hymeniacidonis]MBB5908732.1 nucleotide-binding universal stress UspA family protein [Actinoalloteichus hymeniacidonis]